MRPPRVRFTVRRLMVAVAVAAVAMLVVKPCWDRVRLGRIAKYHSRQADICFRRLESVSPDDRNSYKKLFARFKWHQSMAASYARSAAYPGMPQPQDSPPPDP